ncbi:hypothetical protein SLS53_009422 [Cytospora paraplurivora]|uniref:Heterokaryon incompatibility domain-containing protein n=1 Tax=Cytospora paraplurivora TaxID=2898453 RepID=A0AAN9U585_9PEZI
MALELILEKHKSLQKISDSSTVPPTRLVDLTEIDLDLDHGKLRLIATQDPVQYIALSHCWGVLPDEQRSQWLTTRDNVEDRLRSGFDLEVLPRTFRDAITVTLELGQQYLWIDSLCIIQKDEDDWELEAGKMEAYFHNAYCTIAATSAKDSTQGFLERPPPSSDLWVRVPCSSGAEIFVTTFVDDFEEDVLGGLLNKRAWVLQERALSRRTIHFTDRQTYWECGGGVRCETLTYICK